VYFEVLALEVCAAKEGFEVIKPATIRGTSGIEHKFSFLASKNGRMCAFDMYQDVGQVEVLRTFLKEIDTGATVALICLRGRPSDAGQKLAKEYGFRILTPADIETFFEFGASGALAPRKAREAQLSQ